MPTDFLKFQVYNYSVSSCTCKHEILDLWSITSDCFSKHSSAPLRTFVSSIQQKTLHLVPHTKGGKKKHICQFNFSVQSQHPLIKNCICFQRPLSSMHNKAHIDIKRSFCLCAQNIDNIGTSTVPKVHN